MAITLNRPQSLRPISGTYADIRILKGWEDGQPPYSGANKFRLTFSGVTIPTTCIPWTVGSTKRNLATPLDGTYDVGGSLPLVPNHAATSFRQFSDLTCTTLLGSSFTDSPVNLACGSNISSSINDSAYVFARINGTLQASPLDGSTALWLFEAVIPRCDFLEGVVVNNAITSPGYFTSAVFGATQRAVASGGTCTINRLCCDCA